MSTQAYFHQEVRVSSARDEEFSFFQRLIMRRMHPRSIFIEVAGAIWTFYFLWSQNWAFAIATLVITRSMSYFVTRDLDLHRFSKTFLGKVSLLHLEPFNLTTQLFGAVVLVYGVWEHSLEFTLAGSSLIFLGHVAGWKKVSADY